MITHTELREREEKKMHFDVHGATVRRNLIVTVNALRSTDEPLMAPLDISLSTISKAYGWRELGCTILGPFIISATKWTSFERTAMRTKSEA